MARLNEPAATTETIESLKRKFMRQNRDIARANSTQSLRIRNLENETSRLLAENLGLREQILRLQNELENGHSRKLADHTGKVKSQLETKLLEITELISTLGNEPERKKKSIQRGKVTRASPNQSPDQKNWRNMCTLSEAAAGQEGRLPPILENKSYPRRTLERQDLTAIMSDAAADSTDSPEIGPPPVSQFVDVAPVNIDLPYRERKADTSDTSGLDPPLSINLEQRKKRRDSISGSESRTLSKSETAQSNRENTGSLKTGAKRKLSVRDDEEHDIGAKQNVGSPGDFKFTRGVSEERTRAKPTTQSDKTVNKITKELAVAKGTGREKSTSTTASTTRKVLAMKSVNQSPKKGTRTPNLDEIKVAKADIAKISSTRDRFQEKKQEPLSIKSDHTPATDTVDVQPGPETPAGLDIFSPSSSQPSTARAESRDTPPPPDLGPGTEGQRPSRRARGGVSYAEPNLRDKMRRPTKDLVDAVGADSKIHRNSFVKLEVDGIPGAVTTIKSEPEPDDAWKRIPLASSSMMENSPLSGKVSVSDSLPSSIVTHRKRRESILYQAESEMPRSSSSSAISALLASNRKARAEVKEKGVDSSSATASTRGDLDIYEFRGSSPLTTGESLARASKEEKLPSRSSRRHSSVPRESGLISDSEASDIEISKKGEGLSSRRRQSSLGLRSSSASSGSFKGEDVDKGLRRSTSTTGMPDPGNSATRSDRVAARRRSMML